MSNLGPQRINQSFGDLLQLPNGLTPAIQNVQDGSGNVTPLEISTTAVDLPIVGPDGSGMLSDLGGASGSNFIGFEQTGTGAVLRTSQSKMQETVSVLDFGAVGNGVTDDTNAIQDAINAVYANSSVAGGYQVGGVVFFPKGRYLIGSTLNIPVGITIQGEPSGLDAGAALPPTGYSSGSQIIMATTFAGNMFTLSNGGPITIQNIGLNGTQTVTNSTCLYCGDGTSSTIGLTQGHFLNVRFTGFSQVVKAAKFFDCTFYDCGFEYNTTCFLFNGGTYSSFTELKMIGCIFWGGSSSVFNLSAGATLEHLMITGCFFEADPAQIVNCDIFKIYDATIQDISISGCQFEGITGDNLFNSLAATSSLTRISVTGCLFSVTNAANLAYSSPIGQMLELIYNGCTFKNSNLTANYELAELTLSANIFIGTSVVTLSSCNGLSITGNNFISCSVNPPIVLNDVFSGVNISANIFASAMTGIPINSSSTRIKMIGNTSFADFVIGTPISNNVIQNTSKSTGVSVNGIAGSITMNAANLAAGTAVTFRVDNTFVGIGDTVVVALDGSANTLGAYQLIIDAVLNGAFYITLMNYSANPLAQAVVINFSVIQNFE